MARRAMLRRIVWLFPLLLVQVSAQVPSVCVIGGCHSECLNSPLHDQGRNSYPCRYEGTEYSSCPAAPNGVNYGTEIKLETITLSQCESGGSQSYFFDAQHTDSSTSSKCSNNFAEYADAPALVDGVTAWNDRTYYYTNISSELQGLKFSVGTHKNIKSGWVHFSTNHAGKLYIFAEKTCFTSECIRDGGFSGLDWADVGGSLTDLNMSYDGQTSSGGELVRVNGDMYVWRVPMQAYERLTLPVTTNIRWTGGMAFAPNAFTTSTVTTTTTGSSTTTTTSTVTGSSTTTTTSTVTSTTSTTSSSTTSVTGSTTTISTTTRSTTSTTTTATTSSSTSTTTYTGSTTTLTSTTMTFSSTTTTTSTVSSTTTTTQTTTSTTRTTTSTTTSTTTVTTTTFHGNVMFEGDMSFQLDDCSLALTTVNTDDAKDGLLTSIGSSLGVSTEYSSIVNTWCDSRRLDGDLRGARRMATGSLGVSYLLLVPVVDAESSGLTRESIASSGPGFTSGLSNVLAANNVTVNILGVTVSMPKAKIVFSDPFASTSTTTTTTTTTQTTTTASTTTGVLAAWDKSPVAMAADGGAKEHAASGSNAILFLGTCAIMCSCSICCAKRLLSRIMPQDKATEGAQHEEDISHLSAKKSPKKQRVKKVDEFGGDSAVEIDIQPAAVFAPGRSMSQQLSMRIDEDDQPDKGDDGSKPLTSGFSIYMDDDANVPVPVPTQQGLTRTQEPEREANEAEYEKFSDSKSAENRSVEGAEAEDSVAPLRNGGSGASESAMNQVISLGEDSIPTLSSI